MSSTVTDQETFFEQTVTPERFDEKKTSIRNFVSKHKDFGNKVVLVSSGGTTVPLESRTVRYIDNFSVGTRGSSSAEYFLQHGYAVIFLHRLRSLEPFSRRVNQHILSMLQMKDDVISVKAEHTASLRPILDQYQHAQDKGTLLLVDFTSLGEYLHLLRAAAQLLNPLTHNAMLYLAAAVSDFYIPKHEMPEHKIQSATGQPLQLSLQLVPKMLEPLVKEWAPQAFVVSFKLETDNQILVDKARGALMRYQHQVVVANLLDTRKYEVWLVNRTSEQPIRLSQDDISSGIEIESRIVKELAHCHNEFCKS